MPELTEQQKIIGGLFAMFFMTILYLLVAPFFTIWSLNQLFHLEIVYSFKNYVAVVWLLITLNAIKVSAKKE